MSVQVKGSGTIGGLDEGLVVSGIVTSSTQINVGSNIKLGNAGVITATSFVGSGANLTSLPIGGSNAISLIDNVKARFGTGNDLEIFHNGNHSVIADVGTGNLQLRAADFRVTDSTNAEVMIRANTNGAVELYHNNVKKIETTNAGAVITGICTATEFVPTSTQLSHRNIIINGDMNIAQRGAQSTSDGIKTVDRFGIGFATGAIQQDQITLTSSDTPYAYGFRKSYRLTNTTASTAASAARDIRYQIEAQDIATSGWDSTSASSNITLSFWVKASVSQTYYVFHYVPDSQKNYNWNFTPSANTWTKITKTIPGASGVTFNNDTGPGMSIQIVAYYGNNFTASTDPAQNQWFAWSGSNRIPNMTSTWAGTTNATFEVTGMQLEVGSVATPFEHRSFTEELVRCQRFYQVGSSIGAGYGSANGYARAGCTFATQMRTTPTFTATNTGSGSIIATGRSNTGFYVTYGSLGGTSAGIFSFTADAEF